MSNFTFNISLSVLNHLGRNLYRNFITVLGEAISNSWDANANTIKIYFDKEKETMVIVDDGDGMNSEEFQNRFLKIGYSKRRDGKVKTDGLNRPYIGRKGIGKLALLSCAKKITVISKKENENYVGGVINNEGLDKAINNDLNPDQYGLESFNLNDFKEYTKNHEKGTIIYFHDIKESIRNTENYIKYQIALYFRFSLVDKSFNIFFNDEEISLKHLDRLSKNTQFYWNINELKDPFLENHVDTNDKLLERHDLTASLNIKGFIATVLKPANLKIRGADEKATLDLYVNGRLREKDILKHIRTNRVAESYMYGQIHFNEMDDENDRFTSAREGVKADDEKFILLLKVVQKLVNKVLDDWTKLRNKYKEDGYPDNDGRTQEEVKSSELFYALSKKYEPTSDKRSSEYKEFNKLFSKLEKMAEFNIKSYAECFIAENLLRNFIISKNKRLKTQAKNDINKFTKAEERSKNNANIHFEIRKNDSLNLSYVAMEGLAESADNVGNSQNQPGLSRDAVNYKPIRDAMAHTAILTKDAQDHLSITFSNIQARIKKLLFKV